MLKKLCLNDRIYVGLDVDKFSRVGDPIVKPELIPHLIESGWSIDDYHELKRQKERTFIS